MVREDFTGTASLLNQANMLFFSSGSGLVSTQAYPLSYIILSFKNLIAASTKP